MRTFISHCVTGCPYHRLCVGGHIGRLPSTRGGIGDTLPPVLVYPAFLGRDSADDMPGALATLLGRTRAAALGELRIPCSTSELAHRLDISPGSASKHAAALREAGLLTTTRQGPAVLHALKPMGSALLTA